MERYRAYSEDGRFLAVVRYERSKNEWQPNKVFTVDAPSPYAGHARPAVAFMPMTHRSGAGVAFHLPVGVNCS